MHCTFLMLSVVVSIGVELSQVEGALASHYKMPITLTLRPSQPALIQSFLYYQLQLTDHAINNRAESESETDKNNEWVLLCSFKFKGVYPGLSIINVQTDGMTASLSKSQVWNMLQIDRLASSGHCCYDYFINIHVNVHVHAFVFMYMYKD